MSTPDEATIRDATPSEASALAKLDALGGYLSTPLPPDASHPKEWRVRVWHPYLTATDGIEAIARTREAAVVAAVDGLDKWLTPKVKR